MRCDKEREMMPQAYQIFNKLRLAEQLCDVVLVADGVKFEAHRIILCGCSSYFQALFTSDWNDSRAHEHQLLGVSPEAIRQIIEYAYTGSVLVTADNVESLLAASDRLNILGIVQHCSDFLHNQVYLDNCFGILKIADFYGLNELHQSAFCLILKNFKEVASTSEEFLELTLQQLCDIIEKDELNVKEENVVFDAILRWIMHEPANRKAHISVLLPKVRMARMNAEHFMKTIKNHDLVKANVACKAIVNDVLKAMYELDFESPSSEFANPLTCPRLPTDILLAFGGWTTSGVSAYNVRVDRWVDVKKEVESPWSLHGTVYLNGFVYCIGGYEGLTSLRTVSRFDPVARTWQEVAPMKFFRSYVSVVVLNGFIYAMGGCDGIRRLNTAERYNPETNKWTCIQPMNERRDTASATALDGKIYVCGGRNETESLSTAECYNPLTDEWTIIAPMSTRRHGLGVMAYKGRIYAVGGYVRPVTLHSVEAYDPQMNRWCAVAPMFTPRSHFGIEVVGDLLFVLGGLDGISGTNTVECYDGETGSWYRAQGMYSTIRFLSCCVVPALPSIIQYAAPR